MFADDAFNKTVDHDGAGTLIGNWFEEQGLRNATGEGRSVPQRHMPRSGLLQDFTKTPSCGPRKGDNTFERVYGPKSDHVGQPTSKLIGMGCEDAAVRRKEVGPQELALAAARQKAAEDEVEEEDKIVEMQNQERCFETTTGTTHTKPDEALAEKAEHLRKSCKIELMHGHPPEKTFALNNEALNVPSHTHYTNVEGVTHARMALDDPRLKADLNASAAGGLSAFGKHSGFSKPIQEFHIGAAKDEELEKIYTGIANSQPLRVVNTTQPIAGPFKDVPSLASLKALIHQQVAQVWGAHGYVALRQRLYDHGDNDGFVRKADAISVFRDDLGISVEVVSEDALSVWLEGLITMKKTDVKIGTILTSLRPILAQKDKRRVLETFQALNPQGGSIRLGDWLSKLEDAELRSVIVSAFGERDENFVADFPVPETVFLELFADLAPLTVITPLMAC